MFTRAIVRKPSQNIINGLSDANLGLPDYKLASIQHENYIRALEECGLKVTILEALDDFPDSVFIEDVALCTPEVAIITRPGAPSRRDEIEGMSKVLSPFFKNINSISEPGTLEAGDIMMTGSHYYIGISDRSNEEGAEQLIAILKKFGMSGSMVKLKNILHLKTGLSYLENNMLLAAGEFISNPQFKKYNIININTTEAYAANSIWINGKVIIPAGYPDTKKKIESSGYQCIEVDVSEFRKLDGGVSCLSLRF